MTTMKTIKELKGIFGINTLKIRQFISLLWCACAFAMLLCCDYDNSAWYAFPALLAHFAVALCVTVNAVAASEFDKICKEN